MGMTAFSLVEKLCPMAKTRRLTSLLILKKVNAKLAHPEAWALWVN